MFCYGYIRIVVFLPFQSQIFHFFKFFSVFVCLQGSDNELKAEKEGVSDSESKVDSGVPEVPVPPDDTPEVLNKALSGLSSRYAEYQRKYKLQAICSVF